jgi:tetratricopeptide (TPR) repeat protein
VKLDPRLAEAHYNLARLSERRGDWQQAVAEYQEALRLRDVYVEAHNNYAWIAATHFDTPRFNPTAAVAHARRAAELTRRQNPAVLDTLGVAYAAAGRFDEAVATLDRALELIRTEGLSPMPELAVHRQQFQAREALRWTPPAESTPPHSDPEPAAGGDPNS